MKIEGKSNSDLRNVSNQIYVMQPETVSEGENSNEKLISLLLIPFRIE